MQVHLITFANKKRTENFLKPVMSTFKAAQASKVYRYFRNKQYITIVH